jgi:hypothetical protein
MLRKPVAGVVLAAAAVAAASSASYDAAAARQLADAARRGRALEYATELTTAVGPRLSGSAAYERAATWAAAQLTAAGIAPVAREPFTIPRSWSRATRATARMVSPIQEPIVLESLGWAPSTPDGGIEAEVIDGRGGAASLRSGVRGRVVLADANMPLDDDRRLQAAGAAALLFADSDPDNRLAARVRVFGGDLAPLPSALIARGDAASIRRLLKDGPVRIAFSYRNQISAGPISVSNIIGEIKGRERADEFVIVGAHLDSWDLGPGAQDNATGVAMVLEAARAIAARGQRPRRSIRFALWGGEEEGLLGSGAYASAHESELDRCVAVLNTDGGTGRIIGWTTPGREDVMTAVRSLALALLGGLQTTAVDRSMQYAFDSDGGPFVSRGVPVLDLNVDDANYEDIHHKSTDTIDRVDARNLAIGAATVAVTAFAIADSPTRLAPRSRGTR